MLVTELGMVTEGREEQYANAYSPMLVTELGIVVDWQPAISVLEAVIIIALQFSRESYIVLPLSTTMEVREGHSWNADFPMLVTLLGMVTEVKEEQYANAYSPILVTELGMVMEVREEQPPNANIPMLVTELGMVMEVREEKPQQIQKSVLFFGLACAFRRGQALQGFTSSALLHNTVALPIPNAERITPRTAGDVS